MEHNRDHLNLWGLKHDPSVNQPQGVYDNIIFPSAWQECLNTNAVSSWHRGDAKAITTDARDQKVILRGTSSQGHTFKPSLAGNCKKSLLLLTYDSMMCFNKTSPNANAFRLDLVQCDAGASRLWPNSVVTSSFNKKCKGFVSDKTQTDLS